MALTHDNQAARRAAVAAALAGGSVLSYAQRRALAAQFGCSPTAIYRDVCRLQAVPPTPQAAPAVMQVSAPSALASDRDIAILRLLGRLEFGTTALLAALITPDQHVKALRERLSRLTREGWIWRQTITMAQLSPKEAGGRAQPPPKAPYLYGLTPEGLELLKLLEVEYHDSAYAALRTRDRRAPKVAQAQLTHDLLVSSWCASIIDGARRSRLLESIACQVEYVSGRTPEGKETQRMDAFVGLVFNRTPLERTEPLWQLPWHGGYAPTAAQFVARYALEVDRGTEPLKTLLAKGYVYRTLTAEGEYRRRLGGDVLPVVLAPNRRRAGQIAVEWQHGWPGGAGVISTFVGANHATHGALWGTYYTMADKPLAATHLLRGIFPDLATWEAWLR